VQLTKSQTLKAPAKLDDEVMSVSVRIANKQRPHSQRELPSRMNLLFSRPDEHQWRCHAAV